jgi:hypothetical protein
VVWNPSVALPFFALFLLQCWLVSTGRLQQLLGLAFVATFLVQTHVGYVIPVGLLSVWLTSLKWDCLPLEGWNHAEEVPCGVQA